MADAFKGALERLAAAAQAAFQQAADPSAARKTLAAAARELAAAIEALPEAKADPAKPAEPPKPEPPKPEPPKPEPPKPEPPKPEPPRAPRPEDELLRDLVELGKACRASATPLDSADHAWLGQIPEILKRFSDADKAGPKMTQFLASIASKLDLLGGYLRWAGEGTLRPTVEALRSRAVGLLTQRGAAPSSDFEPRRVRARAPSGETIAPMQIRVTVGDEEKSEACLLVSSGDGTEGSDAIEGVAKRLAKESGSGEECALSAKRLLNLLTQLAGKTDAEFENTVVRYAVNAVQKLEGEVNPSPAKPLLKVLSDRGINEIAVMIGQTFDESYSPNKFERRKVSAPGHAKNSIVKVLQRGFMNKQGVCIQKCILAIASGE